MMHYIVEIRAGGVWKAYNTITREWSEVDAYKKFEGGFISKPNAIAFYTTQINGCPEISCRIRVVMVDEILCEHNANKSLLRMCK